MQPVPCIGRALVAVRVIGMQRLATLRQAVSVPIAIREDGKIGMQEVDCGCRRLVQGGENGMIGMQVTWRQG